MKRRLLITVIFMAMLSALTGCGSRQEVTTLIMADVQEEIILPQRPVISLQSWLKKRLMAELRLRCITAQHSEQRQNRLHRQL